MLSPAARKFRKFGLTVLAPYFLIFPATMIFATRNHPHGVSLWLAALLPVLPILGVIVVLGRYLAEERDGYKREQIVSALLWGTAGTVSVNLLTSYLRIFGWDGRLPPFTEFWVFMGFLLAARITHIVSNRASVAQHGN